MIRATSALGTIATPVANDSVLLNLEILAASPEPRIFPIIAVPVRIIAISPMDLNPPKSNFIPIVTKNMGMKKPLPMRFTDSDNCCAYSVCPVIRPATKAPITPANPIRSVIIANVNSTTSPPRRRFSFSISILLESSLIILIPSVRESAKNKIENIIRESVFLI